MQTVDVLKQAKALIEDPEHWTRAAFVRNYLGEDLENGPWSDDEDRSRPFAYCSVGAIRAIEGENHLSRALIELAYAIPEMERYAHVLEDLSVVIWIGLIASYQDDIECSHADVMELFDRAIDAAE